MRTRPSSHSIGAPGSKGSWWPPTASAEATRKPSGRPMPPWTSPETMSGSFWTSSRGEIATPPNWKRWAMRQHTSKGSGRKFGAATEGLDLDRYRGTLKSLREWFTGKVDNAEQSEEVDHTPKDEGMRRR